MIKHKSEESNKPNAMRSKMVFRFLKHWKIDGLVNLNYNIVSRFTETFYTNITVDLKYEDRLPMTLLVR